MKNLSKISAITAQAVLILLFVAVIGTTDAAAQKAKAKVAAAPKFTGAPDAKFKAFVIKNIGKRVYLKLTFNDDNMPYGYREQNADPVFSVDNYSYFPVCSDKKADAEWTTRCKTLNWDADGKTISGYFKITEPDPKQFRTNRIFSLTPTK